MVAFVFPGQGAQSLGMLSAYDGAGGVRDAVAEASDAVNADLAKIIEEDEAALNQTVNTQPAMLAVGVGVYRAVAARLPAARFMAGHSLGEYSALVCAGAVSLADAARLVARRGELMQSAGGGGGMLAVLGAPADVVEEVCEELRARGGRLWPANYNSDKQIVIAGIKESLREAAEVLRARAAKRALMLPMSVPSHCPLLQPAADAFLEDLRRVDWQTPRVPVAHCARADEGDDYLPRVLAAQLVQPLNWPDILQTIAGGGATRVFESGPGKILTGLGRRSPMEHVALNNAAAITAALAS